MSVTNLMLPYSHQEALTQAPVPFTVGGEKVKVYPLTYGALLDLNNQLRRRFFQQFDGQVELLPEAEQEDFIKPIIETAEKLDFQSGTGYQFFLSDLDLQVLLVWHLCRFQEEDKKNWIQGQIFPNGLSQESLVLIFAMQRAVYRKLPPSPKLNIPDKRPKYEVNSEESDAKIFKLLGEKYHWSYRDVLNLTEYQVFWYTYLFPDEREHIEELEEIAHRNDNAGPGNGPDVPYQPGTLHFNSPEEYEAWLATREVKN